MALPDRFEQAGIILGSAILFALPMSGLSAVLVDYGVESVWLFVLSFAPGAIVGLLIATGRLPVSYSQVWSFSLAGWTLTFVGWGLMGLSIPPTDHVLGVLIWVIGLCLAGVLVWTQPISIVRKRLGRT